MSVKLTEAPLRVHGSTTPRPCPACSDGLIYTKAPYCRCCHAEKMRKWRRSEDRPRERARKRAQQAKAQGLLVEPIACESCGRLDRALDMHHRSYRHWWIVRWLCGECHGKADSQDGVRRERVEVEAERRAA